MPNGDLFDAINAGTASVVTDRIETFTETGIELESGEHLDADIIVTATGLEMVTLGEVDFTVDGEPVDFSETWAYKGFAYSDVPNLASDVRLRQRLVDAARRPDRELRLPAAEPHDATGTTICTPRLRPSDHTMQARPLLDHLSSGYMQRAANRFPKQGDREPWINPQDYAKDRKMFKSSTRRRRRDAVHEPRRLPRTGRPRPATTSRSGGSPSGTGPTRGCRCSRRR